ncbi:MAG: phosphotransferase, partial [Pseudomonadota bacterium]
DALRAERIVDTPEPLATPNGERLISFAHEGEERFVAAFAFMSGDEPKPDADLTAGFHRLGAISARLHRHARAWPTPASFDRKTWSFATTVGSTPHWGPWRAALGLQPDGVALLERLCATLETRLAAFGADADRFGLIHADLRLANLLVDGDRLGVIDFDDCGFGWFVYDFAAAISFIEEDPLISDLQDAWVAGYRSVAPLSVEDEAEIESFILLRRLLLTAWIASHAETPTAQELGTDYTDGTLRLAERYLAVRG